MCHGIGGPLDRQTLDRQTLSPSTASNLQHSTTPPSDRPTVPASPHSRVTTARTPSPNGSTVRPYIARPMRALGHTAADLWAADHTRARPRTRYTRRSLRRHTTTSNDRAPARQMDRSLATRPTP